MPLEQATSDDWRQLIEYFAGRRRHSATAYTFLKKWGSASAPVQLRCDDGQEYVVKGPQTGRVAVNDQIVGRLGEALGAATGRVGLIDVPAELIAAEPELSHLTAGLCHGSLWIRDSTERLGFEHADIPQNRQRFALLAVLYGWVVANDHQFIYLKMPPNLVFSVDHGHFFPGGPNWTRDSLATAPRAEADVAIAGACALTEEELRTACGELVSIDSRTIAGAVATPPDQWGILLEERVALAEYLARRQSEMLERYALRPVPPVHK